MTKSDAAIEFDPTTYCNISPNFFAPFSFLNITFHFHRGVQNKFDQRSYK